MGFATNQDITTTKTNVGSDSDAASSTGSVHAKLKDLKANPSSVIKSVQRGVANPTATSNLAITLSSVNPAKCSVKLNGVWGADANGNWGVPYVVSLTSTTLTIGQTGPNGSNASGQFSWEVEEKL